MVKPLLRLLLITTTMLFGGCFRPNYTPQQVDIPTQWRLSTDEGETLCNFRWWEQFEDPVLNDLILTALRNNQDIKLAISRVFEFYSRLGVVNASLYPTLNGNAEYGRQEFSLALPITSLPGAQRISDNYLAFFNLNWELDFWGRLASASEAAYAELLGQIESRRSVVLSLVAAVADSYITLRGLDASLEVSEETKNSREESVKLAISRFELGETSELEVKQAEAELEIAVIRVIEFQKAIPIQENQLSILLGENPHSIVRGRAIDHFQYPNEIPAGLPSELLSQRPDILQAEDLMIAANARVTEAKALFFPQISLTSVYGSQSVDLKNFLTAPSEMWNYGLSAVQTIFDAGRTLFLVETAKTIRDETLYHYRQTILNAFAEVNNALVACKKNKELVIEHKRQVKILIDYLYLAKLRYFEGEVDYLNVLDAERLLFIAELSLVRATADSFSSVVELYKSLGGGWVGDADQIAANSCLKADQYH